MQEIERHERRKARQRALEKLQREKEWDDEDDDTPNEVADDDEDEPDIDHFETDAFGRYDDEEYIIRKRAKREIKNQDMDMDMDMDMDEDDEKPLVSLVSLFVRSKAPFPPEAQEAVRSARAQAAIDNLPLNRQEYERMQDASNQTIFAVRYFKNPTTQQFRTFFKVKEGISRSNRPFKASTRAQFSPAVWKYLWSETSLHIHPMLPLRIVPQYLAIRLDIPPFAEFADILDVATSERIFREHSLECFADAKFVVELIVDDRFDLVTSEFPDEKLADDPWLQTMAKEARQFRLALVNANLDERSRSAFPMDDNNFDIINAICQLRLFLESEIVLESHDFMCRTLREAGQEPLSLFLSRSAFLYSDFKSAITTLPDNFVELLQAHLVSTFGVLIPFNITPFVLNDADLGMLSKATRVPVPVPSITVPPFDWQAPYEQVVRQSGEPIRIEPHHASRKFVLIHAGMGTGKTTFLANHVQSLDQFIAITPRRTLAFKLSEDLQATSYLDAKAKKWFDNWSQVRRLVIEFESLHYDMFPRNVVILDEIKALLDTLVSETNGAHHRENVQRFFLNIKMAKQVILCNDDLSSPVVRYFLSLVTQDPSEVIIYKHLGVPLPRTYVFCAADFTVPTDEHPFSKNIPSSAFATEFEAAIQRAREHGDKVGIACSSKAKAKLIQAQLLHNDRFNTAEVILYTGDMDDIKKEELKVVDRIWGDEAVRVVIFTSVVSVGVSVRIPFARFFMFVRHGSGPEAETLHQMSKRLRDLQDPVIYVELNEVKSKLFHFGCEIREVRKPYDPDEECDAKVQELLQVPKLSRMTEVRAVVENGRTIIKSVPEPTLVFEAYRQIKPSGVFLVDLVAKLGDSAQIIEGMAREPTTDEQLALVTEEEKLFRELVATADFTAPARADLEERCQRAKASERDKLHLSVCRVTRYFDESKLAGVRAEFSGRLNESPLTFFHDFEEFQTLSKNLSVLRRFINLRYSVRYAENNFWRFEQNDLNTGKYPLHHTTESDLKERLTHVVQALGFRSMLDFTTEVDRTVITEFDLEPFKNTIWAPRRGDDEKHQPAIRHTPRPKTNEGALNYCLRKFGVEIIKANQVETYVYRRDSEGKATNKRMKQRSYKDKLQMVDFIRKYEPYLTELPYGIYQLPQVPSVTTI